MTCRSVPFSSTICCITWPGGTWTGIGIGGDPLWEIIGTVTGPENQKGKRLMSDSATIKALKIDNNNDELIDLRKEKERWSLPSSRQSGESALASEWQKTKGETGLIIITPNRILKIWDKAFWKTKKRFDSACVCVCGGGRRERSRRACVQKSHRTDVRIECKRGKSQG